jgi:acyl-CoA synthetase
MRHPNVERAAAIPMADARLGERICLAVKFRSGASAAAGAVLGHLAEAGLSKYEMPEFFLALADIPLMPNGKVQKAEIVRGVQDGTLKPSPVAPSGYPSPARGGG